MNSDSIEAINGILQQKNISDDCRRAFLCILGSGKLVSALALSDIFGDREDADQILEQGKHDTEGIKDYRIKEVEFFNFRYFYNGDKEIKKNFGVDFMRNDNPCSLFLVGGNGTGKSTLFAALERFYTGRSSHAEAVHVAMDDNRYLNYGFGQIKTSDVGCRVITELRGDSGENSIGLNDEISSASFCSDIDMHRLENSGGDLYGFVLDQMGYGELVMLRARLDELGKNLRTQIDLNKDELSSDEWNEVIEAFLNIRSTVDIDSVKKFCDVKAIEESLAKNESHQEFAKRWNALQDAFFVPNVDIILHSESEKSESDSSSKLASMYRELCSWLEKSQGNEPQYVDILDKMFTLKRSVFDKERKLSEMPVSNENRKDVLNTMSVLIKEKCDSIVQTTLFGSQQTDDNFIEDIMQRFSSSNETYRFCYENGSLSLKITVDTPNGSFEAVPQEYLNTFRFKLFCLALKVAVAFGKMKERNIITPIVIDDVLDASDFENTIKLEQFVYRVFKTYDEKLSQFGKPLQLILLTHDDMVQTAFRRGASLRTSECEGSSKPSYYKNNDVFQCGRLFDKDECAREFGKKENTRFINLYIKN